MQKQPKLLSLLSKTPSDKLPKPEQKPILKPDKPDLSFLERHTKERNRPTKLDFVSSPNKQNQHLSSNQQKEFLSPVSPVHCHSKSPLQNYSCQSSFFNSPNRTTPLENIACFRSNKGKQKLQEHPSSRVLFSGISKDGKYKIQSISLEGEHLAKACEHEKKMNLAAIMQSRSESVKETVPTFQPAKTSSKENGPIKGYAVNTHQGIVRNYNEDRVSITLNIKKKGVKAQFFAIYDGHGGHLCCDFLKDNLHQHLINSSYFPSDPKKALAESIGIIEQSFLEHAVKNKNSQGVPNKSGSCLLVTLFVEDVCYIANLGDSRAIMSTESGRMAFNLSRDHRPSDSREQERILSAGGRIYRTEMTKPDKYQRQTDKNKIVGPLRILPGKLSVSRTIGDIEAKHPQLGGIKGTVSAEPDIRKFRLTGKEDFIIMCCDGILERLQSMETVELVWRAVKSGGTIHQKAGKAVDSLLEESMRRKSADNLTAIVICLSELRQESYRSPRRLEAR